MTTEFDFKCTRKQVENRNRKILKVNYCAAQCLLRFSHRTAYNAGVYGWNFDLYEVFGVAICTGYRNVPGRFVDCSKWEENARRVQIEEGEYSVAVEKTLEILLDFCKNA